MCQWLADRGHEVEVICPPPYYPAWKIAAPYEQWRYVRELLSGVIVTRCPIWLPKKPAGLQRIVYAASFALSSLPALGSIVFRRRPDVIFVLEPSLLNAMVSLLFAKLTGALAWLQVKDFEIDIAFDLGQLRGKWVRRLLLRLESWMMRRFDVVSTISQSMGAKVLSKGVRTDHFVPFPDWVDTDVIFPSNVSNAFRAELAISESTVVVLFAGTLGAKQGLETLIAAAQCLWKAAESTSDDILILICGNGQAVPMLQGLASGLPNVRFIDLQPADRLNALLNTADIHVLPQVPEVADSVLPSKLLGMLASGRPIIATVGAESEVGRLVANCGGIVTPGDATALAHAIHQMAMDREGREQLGFEARKTAVRLFHQERILAEFESQLKQRLARGAAVVDGTNDMSPTT